MKLTSCLAVISIIVIATLYTLSQNGQKAKMSIGGEQFELIIADTDESRAYGLANITNLPTNEGMLFLFEDKDIRQFWMKDTLIPLQILFIDGCTVIDLQEMTVEADTSSPTANYQSPSPADKVIELNTGTLQPSIVGTTIDELCEYNL